jgi:hypothetical protein
MDVCVYTALIFALNNGQVFTKSCARMKLKRARGRRRNTTYSGRKITEILGNVTVRGAKNMERARGEHDGQQSV